MKKKLNKKVILTGLSAVAGIMGFVVNILATKDEQEEIAQRAADILEERNTSSDN